MPRRRRQQPPPSNHPYHLRSSPPPPNATMSRRGDGRQQSPSPPPSNHHHLPPPQPAATLPTLRIHCHADLQALKARSDELRAQLARCDQCMSVYVVSLESVRVARESYALLLPLILKEPRLQCPDLVLLSHVAGFALELHKVEHDLFPRLLVQEAKLEGAVLDALLHLKSSGIMLIAMRKAFKKLYKRLVGSSHKDLISDQLDDLGILLSDGADKVLTGVSEIERLQERIPYLLDMVNGVLATPVRFR